ncbi:unnamed protein product [Ectocarpus sp. CCAP 1310/34]|nr:unnamed protein product [Ectocarpus sp. CCAP 1310/34]
MEQRLDELQLSDEQRSVIDALNKEQVKKKVEEAAAAEHPAAQSEGMPSERGDTRLERPAGSESSPQPEHQPRSPADVSLIDTLARALQRVNIEPEDENREIPTPRKQYAYAQGQRYSLKQQVGEEPRRYLTRASVLRQKFEAYGWVQSDHHANVHYVRNLLPDFHVQRSVLLAHSEVKTALVDKAIQTAWAETEAARKRASESMGAYVCPRHWR